MENQFYGYLKFEQQLLDEMFRLANKQQDALIHYKITELAEIVSFQEQIGKSIRATEEKRVDMLMQWLGISRKDAARLNISVLEDKIENRELLEKISVLRQAMKNTTTQLQNINNTNRLLTLRAQKSVREMMDFVSNGRPICNTEI